MSAEPAYPPTLRIHPSRLSDRLKRLDFSEVPNGNFGAILLRPGDHTEILPPMAAAVLIRPG
jgi:hypothetical protein